MKRILFFLLFASIITAQQKDPNTILEKVKEEFSRVNDYKVKVTINVDVNFLKVPESRAVIYFKQPDQMELKSEGFALLPKQGLRFSPAAMLEKDFNAIYSGKDTLDGEIVDIVKVIPEGKDLDVILSSLWIDEDEYKVRRVETTTKNNGTYVIDLKYQKNQEFPVLPSRVTFTFKLPDMNIPTAISGEMPDESPGRDRKNKSMEGTVTLKYQNYIVNQGVPDSIFTDKKEP